jgi:hypothetical protein
VPDASGCSDLPDPLRDPPGELEAGGEPVDHHVEEVLLALRDLERFQREPGEEFPVDRSDG